MPYYIRSVENNPGTPYLNAGALPADSTTQPTSAGNVTVLPGTVKVQGNIQSDIRASQFSGMAMVKNAISEIESVWVESGYAIPTGPDLTLDGTLMLDGDIVLIG